LRNNDSIDVEIENTLKNIVLDVEEGGGIALPEAVDDDGALPIVDKVELVVQERVVSGDEVSINDDSVLPDVKELASGDGHVAIYGPSPLYEGPMRNGFTKKGN
jgi:hypothetical protein